jgi:hypothetical protein
MVIVAIIVKAFNDRTWLDRAARRRIVLALSNKKQTPEKTQAIRVLISLFTSTAYRNFQQWLHEDNVSPINLKPMNHFDLSLSQAKAVEATLSNYFYEVCDRHHPDRVLIMPILLLETSDFLRSPATTKKAQQ